MSTQSFIPTLQVSGTIVSRIVSTDGSRVAITFCEDGFVDENGVPYLMEGTVGPAEDFARDRIFVSYDDSGLRIIEPINGENWTKVGVGDPIDKESLVNAKIIYHRNALKLNSDTVTASRDELKSLSKKAKYKKTRFVVGGIAMSVLWFIVIGLITIFTADALNSSDHVMMGMLVVLLGVAGWIALFVVSMMFFLNLPRKRLLKMTGRREVMFFGSYDAMDISGFKNLNASCVYRNNYGMEGDVYILRDFVIAQGCDVFLKDVHRGDIVYCYTVARRDKMVDFGCILVKK